MTPSDDFHLCVFKGHHESEKLFYSEFQVILKQRLNATECIASSITDPCNVFYKNIMISLMSSKR